MKKVFVVFALLLVFLLAACGVDKNTDENAVIVQEDETSITVTTREDGVLETSDGWEIRIVNDNGEKEKPAETTDENGNQISSSEDSENDVNSFDKGSKVESNEKIKDEMKKNATESEGSNGSEP